MIQKFDSINLTKIAESGQCFRWKKVGDGYIIESAGKTLTVRQLAPDTIEADCTQEEWQRLWALYFDTETNYKAIAACIDPSDEYLKRAAEAARGIRILRQPLWETIVCFVISQNNNIPRIQGCIDRLCERFNGFPEAKDIAIKGPKGLDGIGLGYRANYLIDAALTFYGDGDGSTERILRDLSYTEAMRYLITWRGIGEKVANCICLYGLNHKEAFPMDVWMKRIVADHYGGSFPIEKYQTNAGVLQQFMFYYERKGKRA